MRAHGLVPLGKRIAHQSAETLKRGVIDPVTCEETVPPARHQTLFEKQSQVFAGIGLRRSRERAELLDGALLHKQGLEQRQAGRVTERAKALGDERESLG